MIKFLSQVLNYAPWVLASVVSGFTYLRLLVGPGPEKREGIWMLFYWIYQFLALRMGFIIGGVIAVVFILTDVFILKSRIGTGLQATAMRALCLFGITLLVAAAHYILEKVVDVI